MPSRSPFTGTFLWIVLVLLLVWNLATLFLSASVPSASLAYSDFLGQVRQGTVATVTFNGQNVTGTFTSPVAWPPVARPSSSPAQGSAAASAATSAAASPAASAASPVAAAAVAATYSAFTTIVPPSGDPALLPLLLAHGVSITAQDTSTGSVLGTLVSSLLPVLLLIGFLVYMGRQAQRSQQGIFKFGSSKARVYDAERPTITFADVAGEDEAKSELAEVVDFLKAPERYRALGARLPRGVLLIGPPGTGKTLLARAVAGEAQVPFFSISASEFVEMFVGVGASRVRDLFGKVKAVAPGILFVDEIDAVGRERGTGMGGGNDEREQTLNQLLVEMDGFDDKTSVIVIAATNRPDVLDPALLRPGRFDRQVTIGYPDRAGREAILRIHTRGLPLAPSVDLGTLARATAGFAGADLANLANEAALQAARDGRDVVGPEQFDEALDRIVLGTRQSALVDPQERRIVAYHEAGHAIVARLTAGADPVQKVTIAPHGQALGVTEQRPDEDRRNYPRDFLVGRLTVMLGGRAAEDVVFGQPTTGAESDLRAATGLARRMVGLWGMSDDLGPVSYGIGETHPFLGRELAAPREFSESTAGRLDAAVQSLIEQARSRARDLLEGHRATLDAVAEELIEHEAVDARRLDAFLGQTGASVPPLAPRASRAAPLVPAAAAPSPTLPPTAAEDPPGAPTSSR
ncbi:MAG: ATP-dependent zinc metalloprotease FtsH [Candidatus Limnocylindrales bacterium]